MEFPQPCDHPASDRDCDQTFVPPTTRLMRTTSERETQSSAGLLDQSSNWCESGNRVVSSETPLESIYETREQRLGNPAASRSQGNLLRPPIPHNCRFQHSAWPESVDSLLTLLESSWPVARMRRGACFRRSRPTLLVIEDLFRWCSRRQRSPSLSQFHQPLARRALARSMSILIDCSLAFASAVALENPAPTATLSIVASEPFSRRMVAEIRDSTEMRSG